MRAPCRRMHFRGGWSYFRPASMTAWGVIERAINDGDYYLSIIGGRYGSVDSENTGQFR